MEIKTLDGSNGTRKCATFSLATSEKYRDRNGNVIENTEWHNVISWNHAELCEKYVQKGSLLYVEGKIRTRSWEDRQARQQYMQQPQQPQYHTQPLPPAGEPEGDDLPF